MHDVELMMSIIIASTALTGLAGVSMGQIPNSNLTASDKLWSRWAIVGTFGLSAVAVLSAMLWFSRESSCYHDVSFLCFLFQLLLFGSVVSILWLKG